MEDILSSLVAQTERTVARRKSRVPLPQMKEAARKRGGDTHRLVAGDRPRIIAEFKRKSPSKADINLDADPVTMALAYERGGAAAISVLTEPTGFKGHPRDLTAIRQRTGLPLLRKDFMIDPYQFYEARAMGADMVLLIARILDKERLASFSDLAHDLGLQVLCEIHHSEELERVGNASIDFLGVNCRNLRTFQTHIETMIEMADQLPRHLPWVAESGIGGREDIQRLAAVGYRLFLIGETLMRDPDPEARLKTLAGP